MAWAQFKLQRSLAACSVSFSAFPQHHCLRIFFSNKVNLLFNCLLVTTTKQLKYSGCTAQKMRFSIKDFFSKYGQIRRKLRIWSHSLKRSLMENFIFCAVLMLGWVKVLAAKKEKYDTEFKLNFTTQNDGFLTHKKFAKATSYLKQNI